MLTQKQKTTPYIGVFKLHTGEEMIATVTEETATELIIKNPLCMVPTANGMQFAPFLMMGESGKPVTISKPVLASTSPPAELETQYESLTTGIALPKKSSIITS
jgi:hypothetical protein